MQATFTKQMTIITPMGLTSKVNTEKTVNLLDANNPMTVDKLTIKVIISNGRTNQSVYNVSEQKVTTTTPEGRQTVSYFDDNGRLIKTEVPGLATTYYTYEQGYLIEIRQEPESLTLLRSKPRTSSGIEAQLTQPANPFLASLFNSQAATLDERTTRSV
jgi:hypothetical protein